MKKETEDKLCELIEERVEALETELQEAQDEVDRLERDQTWTTHKTWDAKGLPVPRLEMHSVCFGPEEEARVSSVVVTQYLVYRHLCQHIEAVPLGQTSRDGGWANIDDALHAFRGDGYELPHRDGAHIVHNMEHLGLPAFATCADKPEVYRIVDRETQVLHTKEEPS